MRNLDWRHLSVVIKKVKMRFVALRLGVRDFSA
jgi:hypothetical protein